MAEKKQTSIYLDDKKLSELKDLCELASMSMNDFINDAIDRYLTIFINEREQHYQKEIKELRDRYLK